MDETAKREILDHQCRELVDDLDNGVHRAYIGEDKHGKPCIVCCVIKKRPLSALSKREVVPASIRVEQDGKIVLDVATDVEESEPATILRLPYDCEQFRFSIEAEGTTPGRFQGLQDCQSPTIKGGSQVAPQSARWVGTHGAAVKIGTTYGSLSNWHVYNGGQFGLGRPICQPHGSGPVFGKQTRFVDIDFNGDNLVDCSFAEDLKGPASLVCIPEQHAYGKIDPRPYAEAELQVGMAVQKVGRTTGHTQGKIVGIRSTEFVGYGPGQTARFIQQIVVRANSGEFSAGGDSGSLIVDMNNRPVALLFAGGGSDTIACPIQFVREKLGIEFFA